MILRKKTAVSLMLAASINAYCAEYSEAENPENLLKNISEFIHSDFSEHAVTKIFGWHVIDDYTTSIGVVVKIFGRGASNSKALTLYSDSPKIMLDFQVQAKKTCIKSANVISKFGNNFRKIVTLTEGFANPENDPEVEENMRNFIHGPEYSFLFKNEAIKLRFYFVDSKCAESVSIVKERNDGKTQ